MKKTVILMCISYGLGIFLFYSFSLSPLIFIAIGALAAVGIKLFISRTKADVQLIFIVACFALGVVSLHFANDITLKAPSKYLGRYVTVQGRICEEPTISENADSYGIQLEQLVFDGTTVSIKDKINVSVFKTENMPSFAYGDRITARGFLQLLPPALNDASFDAALYNKTKGIFFEIKCDYGKTALIGQERKWWRPADAGYFMRQFSMCVIDRYLKGDAAAVTKAILLGEKSGLNDGILMGLQVSGLAHIISVSGLHISSVLMIIGWLFAYLGVRRKWVSIFGMAFLAFIVAYEGAAVTIVRAAIMSGVYMAGQLLKKDTHRPTALAIAALAMLVWNPFTLFDVSFQLSVGCMLGIILFAEPVTKWFRGFLKIRWISASLGTTTAVMVFAAPIIAYYFNSLSLITWFTNLIAVPLLPFVLLPAFALILFSWLWPLAMVLAGFLQMVSGFIGAFLVLMGRLPFAAIGVSSPTLVFIIVYGLLLYVAYCFIMKRKSFGTYMAASAAGGLIVVVALSAFLYSADLSVTFINVGQGDAALITLPGNRKMIIDGGGSLPFSKGNIGESVFVPYLKKHGAFTIDTAVLSHYDQDHAQGVIAAVEQLQVKNLILPYRDGDYEEENKKKLEEIAAKRGTRVYYFLDNDNIVFGRNIILKALSPTLEDAGNSEYNENDRSLVVKLSYGETDFLFPGDIEEPIEEKLLAKGTELDCEVLKVAHHGSDTSSEPEFVGLVSPQYAVISVGEKNPYGHPAARVLSVLQDSGAQTLRTDESGDITFLVNGKGIKKIETTKQKD